MFAKIIAALISPLGTSLLLGLIGLVLQFSGLERRAAWRRVALVSSALGLAWLLLWSTPVVSDALSGWLEAQAGPRTLDGLPQAPVIVVLGGGVAGPRPPQRPDPDLAASADRVWHAARLYHAGKAPRVLLSGGTVRTGDGSEAEAMQRFLLDLGVPPHAIALEDASVNTVSNAHHTAAQLAAQGIHQVILVTSAQHMPRARAALQREGLHVHPAPTDFNVIPMPWDALRLVPDVAALHASASAMREVVGRWVGR